METTLIIATGMLIVAVCYLSYQSLDAQDELKKRILKNGETLTELETTKETLKNYFLVAKELNDICEATENTRNAKKLNPTLQGLLEKISE